MIIGNKWKCLKIIFMYLDVGIYDKNEWHSTRAQGLVIMVRGER